MLRGRPEAKAKSIANAIQCGRCMADDVLLGSRKEVEMLLPENEDDY